MSEKKLTMGGVESLVGFADKFPRGLVFVHEAAKTAAKLNGELDESHPEYRFLSMGPHLGLQGADSAGNMDYSPINGNAAIKEVIYVADNDDAGRRPLKDFHRGVHKISYTLTLGHPFKRGADLADKYPECMGSDRLVSRIKFEPWFDDPVWDGDGAEEAKHKIVGHRIRPHILSILHLFKDEKTIVAGHSFGVEAYPFELINSVLRNRSDSPNIRRNIEKSLIAPDVAGRKLYVGPFDTPTKFYEGDGLPLIEEKGRLYINTYEPPEVIPKEGDLAPWRSFLENHFEIESERDDFLKWAYTTIARPWIKPAWCPVLLSNEKGTGKSTLLESVLKPLVGEEHYEQINQSAIEDKFTPPYDRLLLLCVDEVEGKGISVQRRLKSVISNKTTVQELKGKDAVTVEFTGNIIATGQDTSAFPKEPGERRIWKPQCTEKPVFNHKNGKYWAAPEGRPEDYWRDMDETFYAELDDYLLAAIMYDALHQDEGFYCKHMEKAPVTLRGLDDEDHNALPALRAGSRLISAMGKIEGRAVVCEREFIDYVRVMCGDVAVSSETFRRNWRVRIRNLVAGAYSDIHMPRVGNENRYRRARGKDGRLDNIYTNSAGAESAGRGGASTTADDMETTRKALQRQCEAGLPDDDDDDLRDDAIEATPTLDVLCETPEPPQPEPMPEPNPPEPSEPVALKDPRAKANQPGFDLLAYCTLSARRKGIDMDGEYKDRLRREVKAIEERGFVDYFLIVEEAVSWARERMFVAPGRGSAAGSLAAYCLGITEIDPVEHGLLFERFMPPGRPDAPDIDVDFSDRAAVVEHLRAAYGRESVVKLINKQNYKAKSAIDKTVEDYRLDPSLKQRVRAVVLDDIDKSGDGLRVVEALKRKSAGRRLLEEYPELARIDDVEGQQKGLALHGSKVAIVPVGADPRSLERWTEYTKGDGEAVSGLLAKDETELPDGYVVLDVLSSPALANLSNAAKFAGISYDELKSCGGDERAAFDVLNRGDLCEVFQYGQEVGMSIAERFHRHESFKDVVAFVSLARPEMLKSGACGSWIERRLDPEKRPSMHPLIEDVLGETYGVIVYQEQVMKLFRLGGVPWEDVHVLRKELERKNADAGALMDMYAPRWAGEMIAAGVSVSETRALEKELKSRGGYGFNKSHAASYGLTALRMAWVKAEYPVEFATAFLNGKNKESKDVVRRLAERFESEGVAFDAPDLNGVAVEWECGDGRVTPPLWMAPGISKVDARGIRKERLAGRPLPVKLSVKIEQAAEAMSGPDKGNAPARSLYMPPRGG